MMINGMGDSRSIKSALISVYHKEGLDEIIRILARMNVTIFSTGGTLAYIRSLGVEAISVEEITSYPSILGGRVKTLHPKIFGGILSRRDTEDDSVQLARYDIPEIDLVIVDLYPFEETVASGVGEKEIIEKIDVGGVSLIRAAAKNFHDVLIIPSRSHYSRLFELLKSKNGITGVDDRKRLAVEAFEISSHYDHAIFNYFNKSTPLRYGENPHQSGTYYGNLDTVFDKLGGKEISFNNILDLDAAIGLINDFSPENSGLSAIFKHNNPCGVACRADLTQAWQKALEGDPVSAFGGVVATNRRIERMTAVEINKLFFEIIVAPEYEPEALEILRSKKNRIILRLKPFEIQKKISRSALNGVIEQTRDSISETLSDLQAVTRKVPSEQVKEELIFANKIAKHAKSNAIVLTKNKQLLGIGAGHVSRVDALKFAIEKARSFGKDLNGAVMASDAFFPFADCVEIAWKAGIRDVIQPGGSVRDDESVAFCDQHEMSMVFTGFRHFKH